MARLYAGLDVSDKSTHICVVDEARWQGQLRIVAKQKPVPDKVG